jgi:hypothetical protein
MRLRTLTATLALACTSMLGGANALAFDPGGAPNGPHGCALQDADGNATPVVHQSDTSTIGGSSCEYTQVDTNTPGGVGGSYFATAASWSVKSYKLVTVTNPDGTTSTKRVLDDAASFSSDAGSAPAGAYVIPVGDIVDVTVSDGSIIVGTPNGAPGS